VATTNEQREATFGTSEEASMRLAYLLADGEELVLVVRMVPAG
jgi:hypothetical protein